MRSADEKRLMGDYSAPKSARQIQLPKGPNSDEAEEFGGRRVMAQKPGVRSAHKPRNTLNDSPHAANAGRPNNGSFFSAYTNKKPIQKQYTSGQLVEPRSQRLIYLPPATAPVGDGFEASELGVKISTNYDPRKRQKLEMATTKAAPSSSPVDLTGEDVPGELEVVRLNGKSLHQTASRSQSGSAVVERPSGPFTAHEFKNVSNMTTIAPEKSKRKSKDGQCSSQASSRGTPAEVSNELASMNGYSSQEVVNEKSKHELEQDRLIAKTGTERLDIDLTRGWDEPFTRSKKGTEMTKEDIKKANEIVSRSNGERIRGGQFRGQRRGHQSGRRSIPQPNNLEALEKPLTLPNLPSPRLSQIFQRDDQQREPEQPRKLKASQRMKATSETVEKRVSQIKDDGDSPDELAGEVTIGSQASRSVSPQKRTEALTGNVPVINGRKGSPSSSDLPPTQFHHGVRQGQINDERAESPTQAEDSSHDTDRVRLQAFYATSCVNTTGNLILQYDKREEQFDLYCDDMPQVVPGKQQTVSIGRCEANKFISSHKGHRVYLKGSMSDISNGHICIIFLDSEGADWFLDRLLELTEDDLRVEYVPIKRLNNTFSTQTRDIQMRYEKQSLRQANAKVTAPAQAKRYVVQEDDEIKYEPFQSPRKTTRQSSGRGLFESSPYFPDSQPRRSSRQPKQIKRLSPSPPPLRKWTQENKLQPWTHSVVYPPEGVRRVTVDFQDIERLDEGQFLNDNLISFALRRVQENISPDNKESVYFFNSFFYTALTSKNGRTSFNYDAVQRWTKTTDLLAYQYVVVPINIDVHWFVAIICNLPEVSRRAAGLTDEDEKDMNREEGTVDHESPATQDTEANGKAGDMLDDKLDDASSHPDPAPSSRTLADGVDGVEIQAQTEAMGQLSLSQEDSKSKSKRSNSIGGGRIASLSTSEAAATPTGKLTGNKKSKKKAPPPLKKYDPDQPTIITLDSFGSGHSTETRNLKDYLRAEAEAKRGMDLDTKQLQGMTAKGLPQQANFCDCGLYLVGYVEEFAKDPRRFVTKVLTRQLDQEADFTSFDPSAKRDEIRTELLKLYEEQTAERKVKKSTKKAPAKVVAEAPASSPTPAPATSLKLREPQMLTPAGAPKDVTHRVPELEAQSTRLAVQLKLPVDDCEDDELEQSIPRALKELVPRQPTSKEKVKSSTPSDRLSLKDTSQRLVRTAQDDDMAMATACQQGDDLQVHDKSEEEMLLDPADDPDGDRATWRSGVGQASSSTDVLSGLETTVYDNLEQLENERVANEATNAIAAQLANGKAVQIIRTKELKKDREVIDLETEDDNKLEIPGSQEKQPKA
jgi:sentrin-specific protease 7